MSNYLAMLENHMTPAQNRAMVAVEHAAAGLGVNLFLTGAAMRDTLGGFPVRDLEFAVEGSASRLARAAAASNLEITHIDEPLRYADLLFEGRARVRIITARVEKWARPGGKPQITPAPIHDHLRNRDFTINAIGLSLSRASRGLLIDPNNGVSDLSGREIRAISNYSLYDRPIRLLRLLRLKVRLGFTVAEKTQRQYENARQAHLERYINAEALAEELKRTAAEPKAADVLAAWEAEGLLGALLPSISGPALNLQGFQKLAKARQAIPFGTEVAVDDVSLFFYVLTEKLSSKERATFAETLHLKNDAWQKLELRAARLEKQLAGPTAARPSGVYKVLREAPAEQILFLLMNGHHRVVGDRIRNYFARYLPLANEITDDQVAETGVRPGSPKWDKKRLEFIGKRLDARPKKPAPDAGAPGESAVRPGISPAV